MKKTLKILNSVSKRKKYLLTCALGFGLGGALWGLECYYSIVVGNSGDSLPPMSYILGALTLGVFGSPCLVLFTKSVKKILTVTLVGIIGWIIAFLLPLIAVYYLYLFGTFIFTFFDISTYFFMSKEFSISIFELVPSLMIGTLWLVFFITGAIIGLIYALILKIKIWCLIWRGALGFALGSLIGPVIGNLIGNNLFHSLFIAYLLTFFLIGVIFALFLAQGVFKIIVKE